MNILATPTSHLISNPVTLGEGVGLGKKEQSYVVGPLDRFNELQPDSSWNASSVSRFLFFIFVDFRSSRQKQYEAIYNFCQLPESYH